MSTFLDELLKKMKTAPHVGIPPVTNPKVPTKVEKDTAEYAVRQKAMPNFKFGNGHPTPIYADPKFKNGTHTAEVNKAMGNFNKEFESFMSKLLAEQPDDNHQ